MECDSRPPERPHRERAGLRVAADRPDQSRHPPPNARLDRRCHPGLSARSQRQILKKPNERAKLPRTQHSQSCCLLSVLSGTSVNSASKKRPPPPDNPLARDPQCLNGSSASLSPLAVYRAPTHRQRCCFLSVLSETSANSALKKRLPPRDNSLSNSTPRMNAHGAPVRSLRTPLRSRTTGFVADIHKQIANIPKVEGPP